MRFFCSSRVLALCAILTAADASALPANPIVRMHGKDLSFLLTFDDGTAQPDVGMVENLPHRKYETVDGGVFGRALSAGSLRFPHPQGTVDMTRSGTLILWVKLCRAVEPARLEPGQGFAFWDFGRGKVMSLMKQGAFKWGEGIASLHYRGGTKGMRDVRCVGLPLRMTQWKPGAWRMLAATWTPEKIGLSLDGEPAKEIVYEQAFGPLKEALEICASDLKTPAAERLFAVDEVAVLSRRLSDAEIKALYTRTKTW